MARANLPKRILPVLAWRDKVFQPYPPALVLVYRNDPFRAGTGAFPREFLLPPWNLEPIRRDIAIGIERKEVGSAGGATRMADAFRAINNDLHTILAL